MRGGEGGKKKGEKGVELVRGLDWASRRRCLRHREKDERRRREKGERSTSFLFFFHLLPLALSPNTVGRRREG